MAFESHADLFTERAPIHPGQQRQIVIERFGNMQIDITVCTWPSEQYATTVQDSGSCRGLQSKIIGTAISAILGPHYLQLRQGSGPD